MVTNQPEQNIYYDYVWLDPRKPGHYVYTSEYGTFEFEHEPFYVGKGHGTRYNVKRRNKDCKKIYNEIEQTCLEVIYKFININLEENDAYNREEEIIKTIGRANIGLGPLTNLTDGGRLPVNIVFTEETRQKMKNRPPRHWTDEQKQKNGDRQKGIPKSDEHKQKMRKPHGPMPEEHRRSKMGPRKPYGPPKNKRIYYAPFTKEHKENMSLAANKTWIVVDPYGNETMVYNMKQFCLDNNLTYKSMTSVNLHTQKQHRGYICNQLR